MSVPVLTEKSLRQSRQRYGCGLRVLLSWMLTEPHLGQQTPVGQRFLTNHFSAVALSGNIFIISTNDNPVLKDLPGAFFLVFCFLISFITGSSLPNLWRKSKIWKKIIRSYLRGYAFSINLDDLSRLHFLLLALTHKEN